MIQKLFQKPILITSQNSALFLPAITDYKFAKSIAFLPIGASEMVEAQKCYPIFFVKDSEGIVPLVAMGVREDNNLFINEDGEFQKNCYIPALLRAYPFSVTKTDGYFSLVIDEWCLQNYSGEKKLFNQKGELTQEAQKIVKMVEAVYADLLQTKNTLRLLEEKGLLKNVNITIQTTQKSYIFENMLIVDKEKTKKLDNESIVELFKKGILDIITLHIASLSNIARLGKEAVGA